jgi:hypothetical protein
MASTAHQAEKSSKPNFFPTEFIAIVRKRIEELTKAQTELFAKLQDANQRWMDRWQTEGNLFSEFSTKLTAARSLPEAATAYQDLAGQQLQMVSEDTKQLFADTRALMETGARVASNGWLLNGSGAAFMMRDQAMAMKTVKRSDGVALRAGAHSPGLP